MKNIVKISILLSSISVASALAATSFKPITKLVEGQTNFVAKPTYKVGTEYKQFGITYKPSMQEEYDVIGIASWYGEQFQGNLTANGELFDKNQISAAHPTLPLPSIVEVTNMDNGRKIIVRVNDRGPFSNGRVIDLSKRAAEMLGFEDKGTANVRVKLLSNITDEVVKEVKKYSNQNVAPVTTNQPQVQKIQEEKYAMVSINSNDGIKESNIKDGVLRANAALDDVINKKDLKPINLVEPRSIKSYVPRGVFVQVGAFKEDNNKVSSTVHSLSKIGVVTLQKVDLEGRNLLRLRVGPYGSIDDAKKAKDNLVSMGYTTSRVIVEE